LLGRGGLGLQTNIQSDGPLLPHCSFKGTGDWDKCSGLRCVCVLGSSVCSGLRCVCVLGSSVCYVLRCVLCAQVCVMCSGVCSGLRCVLWCVCVLCSGVCCVQ